MKRLLPTVGLTFAGVATILNFQTRSATSVALSGSATVVSQPAAAASATPATSTPATTAPIDPATAEREQIMSQLPDWVIERIDEQFPEGISLDLLEQVAVQLGVPFTPSRAGGTTAGGTTVDGGSSGNSSSAAPAPTTTLSGTAQVIDGPAANTPFGPYQVEVTIDGGKIVNVVFIRTPRDMQSMAIQRYAIPRLTQQTLENQSGEVDFISGATYTSYAYQQSLQAALDAAGF